MDPSIESEPGCCSWFCRVLFTRTGIRCARKAIELHLTRQAPCMIGPTVDRGNFMRTLLLILGLIALAFGLLWIGQGTGMIDWPAIELHDQANPMGRLWRGTRRPGPGADLAEQAVRFAGRRRIFGDGSTAGLRGTIPPGHAAGECTCSGRTPSATKRAVTPCNQGIALMMRANIGGRIGWFPPLMARLMILF